MEKFDVIIAGLGATGSATAYHLARQGISVLGLDRFHPPHNLGSSHGLTRIIREAYFEHPLYVPLVQRAYQLWAELEQRAAKRLLLPTGGLMIGPPDGALVRGAIRSAQQHRLTYETLSDVQLRQHSPAFQPAPGMVAVREPRAGILFPETAIATHLQLAQADGARLHFDEPVSSWRADGEGVVVQTRSRQFAARRLLLASGAWTAELLQELALPLTIERQVLFWFEPLRAPENFTPQKCPIFICEYEPGRFFYGLPDTGDGVKVACHHEGEKASPERLRRDVDENEVRQMRQILERFLPAANGRLRSAAVCMYTNTPDEHFLFDQHPHHPQVWIASACSGHGFKFSPVLGEIAAACLQGAGTPFDLSLFKLSRFQTP